MSRLSGAVRVTPVERIDCPARETFEAEYVAKGRPVVITGGLRGWKAVGAWSPEALRARCGSRTVPVTFSPRGIYERRNPRPMPFADYLDLMLSDAEGRESYYVTGVDLDGVLPELSGDVERPSFVDPGAAGLALFLGRDSHTNSHFHPAEEAVLCQIAGRKRVILHSPRDFSKLYPRPFLTAHYNWTRIEDLEKADPARYPRYAEAERFECVVEAGDALFIPVHWWHLVLGPGFSASGTYFWRAERRHWHFPSPGLRCLFHRVFAHQPGLKKLVPKSLWSR